MRTCFLNITDGKKWRLEEAGYDEPSGDEPERAYVSFVFDDADDKASELCIMSSMPHGVIESLESMIKAFEEALKKIRDIEKEVYSDMGEVDDNE